ncbi:MAG TPA: hypothetical protein VEX66_07845 [Microlunatus sp.]|nr:hypothetical protein [Microlunatus sp.]
MHIGGTGGLRQINVLAALMLLAALTSTACSDLGQRPLDAVSSPPAQIHQEWPGCFELGAFRSHGDEQPDLGRGSIPADFLPVAAVRCSYGDSEETFTDGLERRATDPDELVTLVNYLGLPDLESSDPENQACPAMAWFPPWLYLVDGDGRWIRPQVPVDACGFARDLFTSDHRLPYDTMTYSDTVVCQTRAKGGPCRPV